MVVVGLGGTNSVGKQHQERDFGGNDVPDRWVVGVVVFGDDSQEVQEKDETGGVPPEVNWSVNENALQEGRGTSGVDAGTVKIRDEVAEGKVGEEDDKGGKPEVVFALSFSVMGLVSLVVLAD